MAAASVLYEGDANDTASIITALAANAASTLIIVPQANGMQVTIYLQGS